MPTVSTTASTGSGLRPIGTAPWRTSDPTAYVISPIASPTTGQSGTPSRPGQRGEQRHVDDLVDSRRQRRRDPGLWREQHYEADQDDRREWRQSGEHSSRRLHNWQRAHVSRSPRKSTSGLSPAQRDRRLVMRGARRRLRGSLHPVTSLRSACPPPPRPRTPTSSPPLEPGVAPAGPSSRRGRRPDNTCAVGSPRSGRTPRGR